MTFEQVAVIPYEVRKERRLYCVLKPLDNIIFAVVIFLVVLVLVLTSVITTDMVQSIADSFKNSTIA